MKYSIEEIKNYMQILTRPFDKNLVELHTDPYNLKNNYILLILSKEDYDNGLPYSFLKIGLCERHSPKTGYCLHWVLLSEIPRSKVSFILRQSYGLSVDSLLVLYKQLCGLSLASPSNADLVAFEKEIKNKISEHEVVEESIRLYGKTYSKIIKKNNQEFRLIFDANVKTIDIQYIPSESLSCLCDLMKKDNYISSVITEHFVEECAVRKPMVSLFQI